MVASHDINNRDSIPIRKYIVCVGYNKVALGQTTEEFWFGYRQGGKIFYSPNCLDRLWGPHYFYSVGVRSCFPGSKAAGT